MLVPARKIRIVRASTISPPFVSTACQSCGVPLQPSGVCRGCALHLIDLALSSRSDDPSWTEDEQADGRQFAISNFSARYDHYELYATAEGAAWELGRGAMGITYKARDIHLNRTVALKVINASHLAGTGGRERLLREARAAARLRHPNIAGVYHLGVNEDNCFYAMEYIEGETLEERIRREGPLPWRAALNIVAQAARALSAAHEQNFIHRDIKPTNVMLARSNHDGGNHETVKVIDFGLVKAFAEEEVEDPFSQTYFAGTPHYASPEQLAGRRVDARSDIYALGMCLRFMLTGDPLVTRLEQTSPPLLALSRSMVQSDPSLRPQTALDLLAQTEKCLEEASRPPQWLPLVGTGLGVVLVVVVIACLPRLSLLKRNTPEHSLGTMAHSPSYVDAQVAYAQGNEHLIRFTSQDNHLAIEHFSKAIALRPDFTEAHAGLASALLDSVCRYGEPPTRLESALASAQRAVALDPNSPHGFTVLGEIHTIQGMHWAALAEYHRALELDPKYPPAMRGFGQLWSRVGQPQRGLPWAVAAAQIEPAHTNSWNVAADASVDLCADAQAEGFYRRCLEINPKWMSAHCGLLHIHLLQGDFAQARRDFAVADSIQPNLIHPLTLMAQVALFSGEYTEAEKLYRRLLTMRRDGFIRYYSSISYLSALAFLRYQAGDHTEGDALVEEAAGLHLTDSEGPQAMYDLAAIRAIQGRREESLSLLKQAIASGWVDFRATQLDPRFEALKPLSSYRGLMAELERQVEQMRRMGEELCSKAPTIADFPVSPPNKTKVP